MNSQLKSRYNFRNSEPKRIQNSGTKIVKDINISSDSDDSVLPVLPEEVEEIDRITSEEMNLKLTKIRTSLIALFSDIVSDANVDKIVDLAMSLIGSLNIETIDDDILKIEISALANYAKEFIDSNDPMELDEEDEEFELASIGISSKNPMGSYSVLFQNIFPFLVVRFSTIGYGLSLIHI